MRVALKVIGGKHDGKEIGVSVPRFVIGRGDTAHLRPASDLVSREHSSIEIREGNVVLTDLDSRNGTYLNGEKLAQATVLKPGDLVRIGKLQFQMVIDVVQPAAKKPKVTNVVEAASRTASKPKKSSLEDSISDWLLEDGDDQAPGSEERHVIGSADTVQFNVEDTTAFNKVEIEPEEESEQDIREEDSSESKTMFGFSKSNPKPKPGKLPPIEKTKHESSTSAADDVLRKFFNRR